jgi:uncharacterized protein (TIGR03437 family)
MKSCSTIAVFALFFAVANTAGAATTVWAFNASFGNPHIQAYDLATGNAVADFEAPNKDALRGRANGRGIAVVATPNATTIYYTLADTPNVYKADAATHADLGIAFTTPLTPGINSLAWDGASFWMVASQPTNQNALVDGKVYKYSPTGQLLQTLVLPLPVNTNFVRNGIEVTASGIVANQGSVPYDIFDFSGNLIHPAFITATFRTTGIAFDGVDYIVADVINQRLAIFNGDGIWQKFVPLAGLNGPLADCKTGNCIVDLAVVAGATPPAGNTPTISAGGVVNGASFLPGVVPGSWLTIKGSNLATVTDTWEKAIVNGKLPTTLDGVSVTVGSQPAFVYFISPTQINVQAPDVGTGPVPVTVTNANGTSAAFTATVAQQAPAFFLWPNNQAIATRQDASLAVKDGTFAGSTTVAAKPGDVLILWGTGFGPTTPTVPAGIQVPGGQQYNCSPVTISLGSASPQVFGCALSAGFAGLYQVAIQVPSTMADGDYAIQATVNGTPSPDGVILSVKQ